MFQPFHVNPDAGELEGLLCHSSHYAQAIERGLNGLQTLRSAPP